MGTVGSERVTDGSTYRGIPTHFFCTKGFGYIVVNDGHGLPLLKDRIFFHVSQTFPRRTNFEVKKLLLGEPVLFQVFCGPKGYQAVRIRLASSVTLPDEPLSMDHSFHDSPSLDWGSILDHQEKSPPFSSSIRPEYSKIENLVLNTKEPFDDAGHIMDLVSKFESRTLSEEQRVMRLQAIEMGFDVALVDRAFLTTDFMGVNRSYESITDLLEQLVLLQSEDRFDPEPLGAFDATSDDFRINAWLTEADNMGFPQNLVLNALAAAEGGFTSLESLLDRVMELQVEEDARGRTVAAEHSNEKGKLEEMRKENDALRDYFSCKICFSAYSVVAFWPCGHLCCCAVCGSQQESLCPVCRQGVSQKRSRITETKIDSPLPGWEDRKPELPDEMKLLDFENQLMKSVRQCKLCKKEDRMVYFLPCNHVVSCGLCSKSVVWCPCCGVLVTEKLTVYIV